MAIKFPFRKTFVQKTTIALKKAGPDLVVEAAKAAVFVGVTRLATYAADRLEEAAARRAMKEIRVRPENRRREEAAAQ
jgi:hypothetical protein